MSTICSLVIARCEVTGKLLYVSMYRLAMCSEATVHTEAVVAILNKSDSQVDRAVESYFRAELASTQRSYDSAKEIFLQFCSGAQCSPLPVTEQLLCRYVSYLADQPQCYLSAVRHLGRWLVWNRQLEKSLPITPKILLVVRSRRAIILWAASCRGYFGFLRARKISSIRQSL